MRALRDSLNTTRRLSHGRHPRRPRISGDDRAGTKKAPLLPSTSGTPCWRARTEIGQQIGQHAAHQRRLKGWFGGYSVKGFVPIPGYTNPATRHGHQRALRQAASQWRGWAGIAQSQYRRAWRFRSEWSPHACGVGQFRGGQFRGDVAGGMLFKVVAVVALMPHPRSRFIAVP